MIAAKIHKNTAKSEPKQLIKWSWEHLSHMDKKDPHSKDVIVKKLDASKNIVNALILVTSVENIVNVTIVKIANEFIPTTINSFSYLFFYFSYLINKLINLFNIHTFLLSNKK